MSAETQVLADMKSGRQNEAIGSDPTVFAHSDAILSQMHSGGHSAVVDASKSLCQFDIGTPEGLINIFHVPHTYS
jgi:hypothetical protein